MSLFSGSISQVMVLDSAKAQPMLSKPGPILAVVAGTRTVIFFISVLHVAAHIVRHFVYFDAVPVQNGKGFKLRQRGRRRKAGESL